MTQAARVQEPSMEEILASIRRIIADDDTVKPSPPAVEPPPARGTAQSADPSPPPRPPARSAEPTPMSEADIDAILSTFDEPEGAAMAKARAEPDVLELTEAMAARQPGARLQAVEGSSPSAPGQAAPNAAEASTSEVSGGLMSQETSAAVDAAFSSLAHAVLVHNARTLDDVVKELLRPMLKAWLDDNLPSLVERLVRMEIERVSRGRG
jgi:cell pole-organizing protein PopZ